MKIRLIFLVIFLFLFSFGQLLSVYAKDPPSVVFLNPGSKDDIFFKLMTTFMQSAADDLDIKLETIYCDRNHIKLEKEGKKLLARVEFPYYLLIINEKNSILNVLPDANSNGVKIFLFNEGILPEDRKKHGSPETIYKNWFAEYLPDDFQAGYLLAKILINQALKKGLVDSNGTLNIAGISGSYKTGSSSQRVLGLEKAISEYPNVSLKQIAPAHWGTEKAKHITKGFLNRYPDITVFWAASDGMALGVAQGVEAHGKTVGIDILTGGIDWADFAIDKVKDGTFTASVGGHYMDGAWGLVMLYDYHFGQVLENKSAKSEFSALTTDNVDTYIEKFSDMNWDTIDFTKFSKIKNKNVKTYKFGLNELLNQLNSNSI